jgi:antagonist of KipI
MAIRVTSAGPLTTIQDLGRHGYSHLGISPSGAADRLSLRIANLLVGNEENAAALEMTMVGATLEFDKRAVVAISGGECDCKLGAYLVPNNTAIEIAPGSVLRCGQLRTGVRAYLAVQGGLDMPLLMGSAATDLRGRFGGLEGRKLKKGDVLRAHLRRGLHQRVLRPGMLEGLRGTDLRVTRGSQQEWFTPETYARFYSSVYSVSEQSDRNGLRFKGDPVRPQEQRQLITDGNPLGGIQVPQDGQPIVLFVDQQTTGGYPKIASVIMADMHRVGQLRPRDEVRFSEVTIPQAVELLREQEHWLRDIFVPLRKAVV